MSLRTGGSDGDACAGRGCSSPGFRSLVGATRLDAARRMPCSDRPRRGGRGRRMGGAGEAALLHQMPAASDGAQLDVAPRRSRSVGGLLPSGLQTVRDQRGYIACLGRGRWKGLSATCPVRGSKPCGLAAEGARELEIAGKSGFCGCKFIQSQAMTRCCSTRLNTLLGVTHDPGNDQEGVDQAGNQAPRQIKDVAGPQTPGWAPGGRSKSLTFARPLELTSARPPVSE